MSTKFNPKRCRELIDSHYGILSLHNDSRVAEAYEQLDAVLEYLDRLEVAAKERLEKERPDQSVTITCQRGVLRPTIVVQCVGLEFRDCSDYVIAELQRISKVGK